MSREHSILPALRVAIFSGTLSKSDVEEITRLLLQWVDTQDEKQSAKQAELSSR